MLEPCFSNFYNFILLQLVGKTNNYNSIYVTRIKYTCYNTSKLKYNSPQNKRFCTFTIYFVYDLSVGVGRSNSPRRPPHKKDWEFKNKCKHTQCFQESETSFKLIIKTTEWYPWYCSCVSAVKFYHI